MNCTNINHMLYADGICIISLSSAGLPQLLNVCIVATVNFMISHLMQRSLCVCVLYVK